ncbi:tannase/feruloyl esterase family alpha/beta hydrolase [Amycolatopsis suaedae]|nr:tannase/feruloyl esterase family alpha/beta hydrolase [Amycolatopsis suaedae]
MTVPADSPARPVRQCADLVGQFHVPGAPTHVTSATVVPAAAEPAYCDVRGYVEPAVRFQLKLPTTYRGRYVQYGCGGFCGYITPTVFPECGPRFGDAAVAATDDGHPVPGFDTRWAVNNQAARDDFFFRAPHVTSKAAKQIIARYYGEPPRYSYFTGCSTGGREALLLAQRYPDEFDGIIAGAPAHNYQALLVYQAWLAKANIGADGAPVVTDAKLPVLHQAVLAACDGLDELVDGQVDPGACRFDPVSLLCPNGTDLPGCLTPPQVETARKLYTGPTTAGGERLYPGAQAYGSEPAWTGWLTPSAARGRPLAEQFADNYLKHMGYPIGTPHSSLARFELTRREFHRLTSEGLRPNAMSLDLGRFQRSGGKLIIWHGWADQAIPAAGTVDYYQRLIERFGTPRQTAEWARLFVIPSMYHCQAGSALTAFDPFRELVAWVENGTPPDRIIATGRDTQGNVVRTRPVFPYPLRARYGGTGSIDDERNFLPAPPPAPPRGTLRWVGEYLHHIPGPVVW